jgi:hypothetical protein
MIHVEDTFAFVLGNWALTRTIDDQRSGNCGRFEGTSSVVELQVRGHLDARRASYEEAGELAFGPHVGPAHRHLDYVRRGDAAVMIYFGDGRPYLDLDLTAGEWRAEHVCGEDLYEIVTVVRSHNLVEERWRATGPTTAYTALATLRRTMPFTLDLS